MKDHGEPIEAPPAGGETPGQATDGPETAPLAEGALRREVLPMRLRLHPEAFGQAFPESRDARPDWLPADAFASVTSTEEEYFILCPQRHIPESIDQVRDLRMLFLHPDGPKIADVMSSIDGGLREGQIPAMATFSPEIDLGFLVVGDDDLPRVRSILAESGHTVEEPQVP